MIASRSNIYDKIVKWYWNNFIDFVDKYISTDKIIQAVSKDYYHIRIKNEIDRELDVRYMRELTNKFYPNK